MVVSAVGNVAVVTEANTGSHKVVCVIFFHEISGKKSIKTWKSMVEFVSDNFVKVILNIKARCNMMIQIYMRF